jgi:hypothetical protein
MSAQPAKIRHGFDIPSAQIAFNATMRPLPPKRSEYRDERQIDAISCFRRPCVSPARGLCKKVGNSIKAKWGRPMPAPIRDPWKSKT